MREQVVRYKEVKETDCSSVVQAVLQPPLHNWVRLQRYGEEEDTTKGHTSIHFILSCPDSELHLTVHSDEMICDWSKDSRETQKEGSGYRKNMIRRTENMVSWCDDCTGVCLYICFIIL